MALLRVDYNVPLNSKGRVQDPTKIKESFPTIDYLLKNKVKVALLSHLEHEGKVVSLQPIYKWLQKKYPELVFFKFPAFAKAPASPAKRGESAGRQILNINLLENTRFLPGETENDPVLAKQLASLGDLFINEAFSVSHRNHVSTVGLSNYLPTYLGFNHFQELKILDEFFGNIKRPFVAIVGGAKWETKLPIAIKLAEIADHVLLGGILAREYLRQIQITNHKSQINDKIQMSKIKTPNSINGQDIDTETIKQYSEIIKTAKTVLWNGPMGKYEEPKYRKGSLAILKAIALNKNCRAIVGGEDTLPALRHSPYLKSIYHVTTAGGALLNYVANLK